MESLSRYAGDGEAPRSRARMETRRDEEALDPAASIVDQLVSRGPEVETEGGNSQAVRTALGHENTDHLFSRVDVSGRAEGAVPAEASGDRKIDAPGDHPHTEAPPPAVPEIW